MELIKEKYTEITEKILNENLEDKDVDTETKLLVAVTSVKIFAQLYRELFHQKKTEHESTLQS